MSTRMRMRMRIRCSSRSARSGSWGSPFGGLTHSCRSFHAGVGATSVTAVSSIYSTTAAIPTASPTGAAAAPTPTSPPSLTRGKFDRFLLPASSTLAGSAFATIRSRIPAASLSWRRFYSSATRMPPNAAEWPAARVRKTFFDFFHERGHTVGE